jgi:hypothetical protein
MTNAIFFMQSPYLRREFEINASILRTCSFRALAPETELLQSGTAAEGLIRINGKNWLLGGGGLDAFQLAEHRIFQLQDGGQRLEILLTAPSSLPAGLKITLLYEAPGNVPVLIKSFRVDNDSTIAVHLDGAQVEAFTPTDNGSMSLMLDDDFVRDAQTIEGRSARSPWIEDHQFYVSHMLGTHAAPTVFAYPHSLDIWLAPGDRFSSFRVFEFIMPRQNEFERGLAWRRATRTLWPWTRKRLLGCILAPAEKIEEYYEGVEKAAEVGFEAVTFSHGWIHRFLTSPLFTNYSDYELRSELFPDGWAGVRRLTDFVHAKGMEASFYTIYVNTWRDPGGCQRDRENNWKMLWAENDKSARWGETFDPGSDWGLYVNRRIEEVMHKGGFDSFTLDGPYYGDVNVAENRGVRAGGPNQVLGWNRQKEFYQRMKAQNFHGEAAQGFCAFANGMSRITTTGYNEGDFHARTILDQVYVNRRSAYHFVKLYRPEMATTFIPLHPWDFGSDEKPKMIPLEEHLVEYNAYLGFVYGYGFEGKPYQKVPYDGPRSKEIVMRWLKFWKDHALFFKEGELLHVREPNGTQIDAVAHVVRESKAGSQPRLRTLLVAFNPTENDLTDAFEMPFSQVGMPEDGWTVVPNAGAPASIENGKVTITVASLDTAWCELERTEIEVAYFEG